MSDDLPKLVRDRIPEIIEENEDYQPDIARVEDYPDRDFYGEKVVEESRELLASENREKRIEELADIKQALIDYQERHDITDKEVRKKRLQKKEERGDFSEGVILEEN